MSVAKGIPFSGALYTRKPVLRGKSGVRRGNGRCGGGFGGDGGGGGTSAAAKTSGLKQYVKKTKAKFETQSCKTPMRLM